VDDLPAVDAPRRLQQAKAEIQTQVHSPHNSTMEEMEALHFL
jgi:hypothetical protein